jgi:hypothetical protein
METTIESTVEQPQQSWKCKEDGRVCKSSTEAWPCP